jgi:hypothetical protein
MNYFGDEWKTFAGAVKVCLRGEHTSRCGTSIAKESRSAEIEDQRNRKFALKVSRSVEIQISPKIRISSTSVLKTWEFWNGLQSHHLARTNLSQTVRQSTIIFHSGQ